jgi:type IV pilus assembly protein PilE
MMMSFFKINKSRGQGFTLIELMIVVMIVAVLAAIAFPSYTHYMDRGKRAEGRAMLMDAASKMEKHYGDCFRFGTAIAAARDCAAGQVNLCGAATCSSVTGKYTLTLNGTTSSYVLNAAPAGNFTDDDCGDLALRSTGEKCILGAATCSNTNAADADAVAQCWGR